MPCQLCASRALQPVIELGHQPPSDGFLTAAELTEPQTSYPLTLVRCEACQLVQLERTVDPRELFTDSFVFRTGRNRQLASHFEALVDELVARYELGEGDFVVDVGSNDGTLLGYYPDEVTVCGVDPSKAATVAVERGIPTRREFFTEELAAELVAEHGHASVVTCTNVFAHVAALGSLARGISTLLGEQGVFVQESQYLLDLIEQRQYDHIYHEHLRYYSLASLLSAFDRFDLEAFEAERVPTQGGSIRTLAGPPGTHDADGSVEELLAAERAFGLREPETFERFAEQVERNRLELLALLAELRRDGKTVAGVGAGAKGTARLNYCRIGPELVEYVAETNEFKLGKFVPGVNIPIVDEARLFEDEPDYALLLAWNLEHVIVPKLREKGYEGKIIVPCPEVEVLE